MEIWHISEQDPFMAGTDNLAEASNRYVKLEDVSILFCRQGHARIAVDLAEYELTPNTQAVLLAGSIIYLSHVSDDFLVSFVDFSQNIFQEVTARLEPSFFRFLKDNPCVILPERQNLNIYRLSEAVEDIYNDRKNSFRLQIAKNFIQSFLLDIYDKTQRLFLEKRPEGLSRQEELFKRFIQLVHKHCRTRRDVAFYAEELYITPRDLSTVIQNVTGTTAKSIIDKHVLLEIKT